MNDDKETTYGTKMWKDLELETSILFKVTKENNISSNDETSSAENAPSASLDRTINNNNNDDTNEVMSMDYKATTDKISDLLKSSMEPSSAVGASYQMSHLDVLGMGNLTDTLLRSNRTKTSRKKS